MAAPASKEIHFTESLPDFGSIKECPKCGNTGQFFTKYSRGNLRENVIWEVLQVMCGNCGWTGQTKTKDASKKE